MIRRSARARNFALRAYRLGVIIAVIWLLHAQHAWLTAQRGQRTLEVGDVAPLFPMAAALGETDPRDGRRAVLDHGGDVLGSVVQTSPASDGIIGYAGATNTLVAFGPDGRISGLRVLGSDDTREHVTKVVEDAGFHRAFSGLRGDEVGRLRETDAVTGATLTSTAIVQGVLARLGGPAGPRSLRFPDPVTLTDIQRLFPEAASMAELAPGRFAVSAEGGVRLGTAVRTSPAADTVVGYQGPTEALVGVGPGGEVTGFVVLRSFDNEPYVGDIASEDYFMEAFDGMAADEVGMLDLEAAGIEGVTGSTLTSYAVAEGIVARFRSLREQPEDGGGGAAGARRWLGEIPVHELGTVLVVVAAGAMAFTGLRGRRVPRTLFQLVLVGYLGLTVGNLLAQSLAVGWSRNGVPWDLAPGLAFLALAAVAVPLVANRNLYCDQICPHGAAQKLVRKVAGARLLAPVSPRLDRVLRLVPGLSLLAVLAVAMAGVGFNFAAVEPFNAYLVTIAGAATVLIALAGLVAAVFVPLPYCKYGCPTGVVFRFLRTGGESDGWTRRDWAALVFLGLALVLTWQRAWFVAL